jgi:uncharacterized membrane protein YeaQ/YmgE (transglycosylase-associated protein family)
LALKERTRGIAVGLIGDIVVVSLAPLWSLLLIAFPLIGGAFIGAIIDAFIGAVILLFILQLIK